MGIRRRLLVLLLLVAAGAGAYFLARRLSPSLVAHVVQQTLAQKAPPGENLQELARRFDVWLASARSPHERLERLMRLAAELEKVQRLDRADVARLLAESAGPR
jgi:hypothetical protein